MNGKEFTTISIQFIEGLLKEKVVDSNRLYDIWHGKSVWTEGTIGLAHASGKKSPFGEHLKKRYGHEP